MLALLLKVTLAPALVATATLAARRAGHGIAGMISGLPVVAAPIILVLSVQEGGRFARTAAAAAVLGVASLVLFCVVYALSARRFGFLASLVAANLAFGLGTLGFYDVRPPLAVSVLITAVTILAGSRIIAELCARVPATDIAPGPALAPASAPPGDLLLLRLLITAAAVLALTALARGLSAHLAGLLTPFPIITAVMAAFTHARAGGAAVPALLSGLVGALLSFLAFFGLLAGLLPVLSAPAAYLAATAGTVIVWSGLVWWRALRPLARGRTPRAALQ